MSRLLTERFGANATLSGGVLTMTVTDLTSLDSATPSADQLLAALIIHNKAIQGTNDADDATIGVTIDDPYKSFARSDAQIQHSYSVNLYEPAGSIGTIDPDDVVS